MRQLFSRSFSSVHVHYVPLQGHGHFGTSSQILSQTTRLGERIKRDTLRVQSQRAESWTRLDTRQMSLVIDHAFKHLASGRPEPFDFGLCREQISNPVRIEKNFSQFLGYSLRGNVEARLKDTALVLAAILLRDYISTNQRGL